MARPTGSGKTTTLYAVISEIDDGQDKIITVEPPIEYQLLGILQIPVNEKKNSPSHVTCARFCAMTLTKSWRSLRGRLQC